MVTSLLYRYRLRDSQERGMPVPVPLCLTSGVPILRAPMRMHRDRSGIATCNAMGQ